MSHPHGVIQWRIFMKIVDANIILRYLLDDHEELLFTEETIDFVDAILIARNRINKDTIFSFDKKLNKLLTPTSDL